ncbi:MAG: hypothetical protein RBG13Loki_0810 [Promethearchaeota archaeon CR_4]|nr:MAG: hypothetical protein RBG13Loki_0810 [Candidatus Lokiarchaeota archaeon CR_4]
MIAKKKPQLGLNSKGIYNEAVTRIHGENLRESIFHQIKSMAQSIKSMFGPNGLSKMIITFRKRDKLT